MKILSFAVNNFRGISGELANNRINFDNSNTIFIFGQNNVGKSTFLLAYNFLYSNLTATENDFHQKNEANQIEFELEALIDQVDLNYINVSQEKKNESFQKYLSEKSVIKIRRTIGATREKNKLIVQKPKDSTWNPGTKIWDETAFGTIGLSTVFQHLLPTPILIKAMPTEEEVEKVVNEILASKAKNRLDDTESSQLAEAQEKIKLLQEKMYNPISIEEYKKKVNEHFCKLFPDTSIDFSDTDKVKWTEDKFGKKFEVHFQKQNPDGSKNESVPTSYATIGHGAVRGAIFSLLLMRDIADEIIKTDNRKEYLILFEEPELFLHPKIMRELRELIYFVSEKEYPYQILCASHSPQMIDISKDNSSLIRMVRECDQTKLFQVGESDLLNARGIKTKGELRQELFEVLRFNPHICESFYADEVVLVEGATEEIVIRGILQQENPKKELFIVNCNSITNIPFYQKIYSKFSIKHHVICDTDSELSSGLDEKNNPIYENGIQATIYKLFMASYQSSSPAGILRMHNHTFEPAHKATTIDSDLKLPDNFNSSDGKPYNANRYWKEVLLPNYNKKETASVPIIKYMREIIAHKW